MNFRVLTTFLAFLLLGFRTEAQIQIISEVPGNNIVLNFQLPAWQLENQPGGKHLLKSSSLVPLLKKGAPDLLCFSESIALDQEGDWKITVIDSAFTDYQGIHLLPSKGNIKRPVNPASLPFTYGPVYSANTFWPASTAQMGTPYIMRSVRGTSLKLFPFEYNPMSKVLRVFSSITVKVEKTSNLGQNPLPAAFAHLPLSNEWKQIINQQFINGKTRTKYSPLSDEGSMLIVCHNDPAFLNAMQPFVKWKTQRGMKVTMIDYSVVGGTPAGLKSYIQNNFPVEAWTFVLLVGDAPQISPMYIPNGPSDNDYAYLAGNDSYPELIIGRFSAETATQVNTMVEKIIWYERDIDTSATWLSSALCIGSDEGPGDDNQFDWEHSRELGNVLSASTYTGISELFDGSHGGLDAGGNPSPADVSTILEGNGAGIINYTGHGSNTSIVTTGFSGSDVNNLDNVLKLPFFISVGCVNGEFQAGTCFAENWLRARKNNQLTGAVGTFMSTINQSWDPPMEAQDEMVNIIANTLPNNIKRSFGGVCMNGCMQMNDAYGNAGDEMTDTWVLFGDPSLLIRTATPQNMVVNHPAVLTLGDSVLTVFCNVNQARITLTQNGVILGSEIVNAGQANFNFTPVASMDSICVTAVAYNYVTYTGNIMVIAPNAPFISATNFQVNDATTGNNNQQADYQETFELQLQVNNLGSLNATGISGVLSSNDSYITAIPQNTFLFGDLNAGSMLNVNAAFQIQCAGMIPEGHPATFVLTCTDSNGQSWNTPFTLQLHAPVLLTSNWQINDINGNQNGRLDPGEMAEISLLCQNTGSSPASAATIQLQANSSFISITNPVVTVGTLLPNSFTATFQVQVSPATPIGTWVNFNWTLSAGPYQYSSTKPEKVGIRIEDFESGDFSAYPWQSTGNNPWFTSTQNPFEGNTCSQSGTIGDSQSSTLQIQIDLPQIDTLYFMHRESSEEGYDFLRFYSDAVKKGEWSGNTAWTQAKITIGAGPRTLKWVYTKDSYGVEYDDCVWIDEIIFPTFNPLPSGIENTKPTLNGNWSLGPNPSNGILMIEGRVEFPEQTQIDLFNSTGALINRLENNSLSPGQNRLIYSLNTLPDGIYLIRINENGHFSHFKWIKNQH